MGRLAGDEREPLRIDGLPVGLNGFQADLHAYPRQCPALNGTKCRQRLVLLGENLADQSLHPAHVARAGDECADLDDGAAPGFVHERLEPIADLLRQQSFGGKRSDVKLKIHGIGRDGRGRIRQQRGGFA